MAVDKIDQDPAVMPVSTESGLQEIKAVNPTETSEVKITALPSKTDAADITMITEKTGRLINVFVTDKKTGTPIENATVFSTSSLWSTDERNHAMTDKAGYCEYRWDRTKDRQLPVWVRKDGYVRMSYKVRSENSPGEDPIEIHYAMERATTIGGIVQTAEGNTMAGVELTVRVNDDEHMDKPENHVRRSVTTDDNGRWEFNGVPVQLDMVNLTTKHADYCDQNAWLKTPEDIQLLRDKQYVLVVDQGYSIKGTVKDEAGNPVNGARVQLGDYYFAQDRQHRTHTDDNGKFDFKQLRIGNSGSHYEFVEGQGNVLVRRPFDYIAVTADSFFAASDDHLFQRKAC
jgi:hypothetical protein